MGLNIVTDYNAPFIGFLRYWHRSLNPKKLIEVKFSHLSRNMTMQRHLKLYRLPEATKVEGLRKIKATDVPEACKLLNKVLKIMGKYPEKVSGTCLPVVGRIQAYSRLFFFYSTRKNMTWFPCLLKKTFNIGSCLEMIS